MRIDKWKAPTGPSKEKRWLFLFFISFFLGILYANFYGREANLNYIISQYKYKDVDSSGLFLYCLGKRMMPVLFLGIMGVSFLEIPMIYLSILWQGFSFGVLLSIVVMKLSLKGIIIGIAAILPQFLIYVPVYIYLYRLCYEQCSSMYGTKYLNGKKSLLRYIAIFVVLLIFLTGGIFLESYVNPILLKSIIK